MTKTTKTTKTVFRCRNCRTYTTGKCYCPGCEMLIAREVRASGGKIRYSDYCQAQCLIGTHTGCLHADCQAE